MDMAGGDAIDPNIVPAVVDRHGVAEADDSALGRGVGVAGPAAASPQADDGGQVYDGTAAGLNHPGDGVLAGEHDALEIDVNDSVPKLFFHIGDGAGAADADIVD